ncbi:DUF2057 family protein [Aeromonas veronii]|uniref:YccT family protein n=1 Tax=Aeromonas veronii TaxID=654 RepID=UPI0013A6C95E|nr:DUF2057 family protein [Aeromonas veronii]MBL0440369.1 DUF2057 domain-containing protein [Aeromonas veronii]MBL0476971.1 DUF2057 domain-containing protein [Aeromonas veronii]
MKKTIMAALIATLPSVSQAAVNLEIGRGVELVAVNGIPVDSPLFIGKVDNQSLPDGDNQIAIKISQLVKDKNNTKKYNSHVHVLTFHAANQAVSVEAPMLQTWERGEEFDKQPQWKLSSSGNTVSYKLGELVSMTNMSVLRNFGEELDAFNRSNQPAALPQLAGAMQGNVKNVYDLPTQGSKVIPAAVATKSIQPSDTSGSAPQQARFWFDKMTPTEKRDFISWAAQNL